MTWSFEHSAEPEKTSGSANFLTALHSATNFFDSSQPLWCGRAPGRLDLMGGIADYSGSLVLELPLAVATWVTVQPTDEAALTILSSTVEAVANEAQVTIPLALVYQILERTGSPTAFYETAHTLLTADSQQAWVAYVVGILLELQHKYALPPQRGLHIFIYSDVPTGKGVSSSAALEVATLQALCGLYDLTIEGREMALLCQRVENLIVGAPCGVMDQMTAACGEQESLLALLCQPAELQESVRLPEELEVWGIDSGIRHAVTGADYGSVRVGAFMGYRIIAELEGLDVQEQGNGKVHITDPFWHGYLANIEPSLWEGRYREQVPTAITGANFLAQYRGFTDAVTRIDPERTYVIRQPTAHPIYEHHRVRLFRALLAQRARSEENIALLGELMYQSHASYSACGLGSHGTDRLVELVREAGSTAGLYGAKITGGGSGGTVAILARSGAKSTVERIATRYSEESGLPIEVLGGSSPGAVTWKSQRLSPL